jgi:HSP20 family protein
MRTVTYANQHHSSLTRKRLMPLFRDRMSYNYSTFLNLATMREDDDGFVLNVSVPGLNKKDLNIQIDGSTLIISSTLPVDNEKLSSSGLRDVSYSCPLPLNADPDRITAKCKDGLLTIQIPKLRTKSTRITIPVKGLETVTLRTSTFKTVWNQVKKKFNFSENFRLKKPVRSLGFSFR